MRIPLNVLLYQLSANSIYENQNIDLTCSFDGVQLFDQTQLAGTYENELYLVADQVLLTALSRTSDQDFQSNCTFLCICQDEKLHVSDFPSGLSMVLLYTDESFPLVFNRILKIFHDFDVWDKKLSSDADPAEIPAGSFESVQRFSCSPDGGTGSQLLHSWLPQKSGSQ